MDEVLVRVELPWACFGLIIRDNVVVDAAPIARWAVGKPARTVLKHYQARGAILVRLA